MMASIGEKALHAQVLHLGDLSLGEADLEYSEWVSFIPVKNGNSDPEAAVIVSLGYHLPSLIG